MFNFLLLAFILIIPLENKIMTWGNFGGGFNLTNIFLIILIIFWILLKKRNVSVFIKNPLNIPIFVFILFTYLSIWTGFVKFGVSPFGEAFHEYKRFITLFVLFFLIVNNTTDLKNSKMLIRGMTFMIILIALFDIKEIRSIGISSHFEDDERIALLGMNANYLGSLFAQYLPLLATLFVANKKIKNKFFYLACFLLCLPALAFTYSRGAYLATAGAILAIGLIGGKKTFVKLVFLLIVAIFIQSFVFGKGELIPNSIRERVDMMKKENADQDISVQQRKEAWIFAKEGVRESPVFGYGFGASHRLLPIDIHNMYMKFAFDCGIPTLLIFIWFILIALKVSFRAYTNSTNDFEKAISLGCIGALIAMIIANLFGERFNRFAVNGYLMVLLAMVTRIYAGQELNKIKMYKKVNSK